MSDGGPEVCRVLTQEAFWARISALPFNAPITLSINGTKNLHQIKVSQIVCSPEFLVSRSSGEGKNGGCASAAERELFQREGTRGVQVAPGRRGLRDLSGLAW